MRKLIVAVLILAALLLAPLLLLRSESTLIRIAYWAVDTFTDLRLELKLPVIRPFRGVASAAEIHLYPKDDSGPPFLSILGFNSDLDVRDFYIRDLSRTTLGARSVTIYISDRDDTADPAPLEWLQYLRWLPMQLDVQGVHLVTASENTFIFPLEGLTGHRSKGGHFTASARAQYEGEPLDFILDLSTTRDQVKFTGLDLTGRFRSPDSGSEVRLDGELRGTIEDFNYDFKLVGNYKDVGEFMSGFRAYSRFKGGLQVQARLQGDTHSFELKDAQFLLNNLPHYGIEAAGSMRYDANTGSDIRLVASGELTSMELLMDWLEIDLKPLGRAQGSASISGTLDRPVIDQFILQSESDTGLFVNVRGRLELEPDEQTENRISADIHGPQLSVLEPWTGPLPYEIGEFSASGTLAGKRGDIALERLILELGSTDTVAARVEGTADTIAGINEKGLAGIQGLALSVNLFTPDTGNLASLIEQPLPSGFELRGELDLNGNGDRLMPAGGFLELISSDIVTTMTPTAGSLMLGSDSPLSGLRADIGLEMSDTSALSQFTTDAVPALGPVTAEATLVQGAEHISLEKIQLAVNGDTFQLQSQGAIGNLNTFEDTHLSNQLSGVEPRDLLMTLVDEFDYHRPMGELEGSFSLNHAENVWILNNLSVTSSQQDGPLYLRVDGSVSDLTGLPAANLNTHYRIRDPALLEAITGLRMNPAEGESFIRTSANRLDIENNTRVGGSSLAATASVDYLDDEINSIKLLVESPRLHLLDLGLQAVSEGDRTYKPADKLDQAEPVGRFEELLNRAPRFATDITVDIEDIDGENTSIDKLDLHVTGVDNRYTLRRFSVGYDDTVAEVRGIIDLNARPPFVSIAGEALAIPLNTLGRDLGRESDIKGYATIRGGLASHGYNADELLKDMDGSLAIALENAEIEGAAYDVLATDILAWFYSGAAREKSTHIDCTMGQFVLLDGVAKSDSLYIETDKMVATGSAKLDMVQEKMDVTITPRSKSRQFQVPSSIRLRGSFDDPKTVISPVAAAADAYAEFITLVPRMVIKMFGGKSKQDKTKRPCVAVN
jgi:AsmA family